MDGGRARVGASDEGLLALARAGDSTAWFTLWLRHEAHVRQVAGRATRSRHDAEDVVAMARDATWRAIRNGRGPMGPLRPYLTAAVRNLAARHYRTCETVVAAVRDDASDPRRAGELAHDEQLAVGDAMRSALRNLRPRHREVLVLGEVMQLSSNELGQHFGISANAVAQLRVRARGALRAAWSEERPAS